MNFRNINLDLFAWKCIVTWIGIVHKFISISYCVCTCTPTILASVSRESLFHLKQEPLVFEVSLLFNHNKNLSWDELPLFDQNKISFPLLLSIFMIPTEEKLPKVIFQILFRVYLSHKLIYDLFNCHYILTSPARLKNTRGCHLWSPSFFICLFTYPFRDLFFYLVAAFCQSKVDLKPPSWSVHRMWIGKGHVKYTEHVYKQ